LIHQKKIEDRKIAKTAFSVRKLSKIYSPRVFPLYFAIMLGTYGSEVKSTEKLCVEEEKRRPSKIPEVVPQH
jgi:hypothetical protein